MKKITNSILNCFMVSLCFATSFTLADTLVGQNGAVTSRSKIASEAGIDVLRDGGNAVDAAVATAFALAVTYPSAGNLGGGGFAMIYLPDGTVVANDHREKAPAMAYRDMFLDDEGAYVSDLSLASHLASGVPGSVAGLLDIHEAYGVLPREKVMAAAIELAATGFRLPSDIARQFAFRQSRWLAIPSSGKVFLKPDQTTYRDGEVFRQPDLASTLKRIATQGRKGFYEGQTAELIVAEMARHGGLISLQDLENYESVWRDPVVGTYRGYEIYSMPPPSSGGVLLLQLLNMLEQFDVSALGFGTPAVMHLMIEAERRAYADRAAHLGDSDFYPVPIATLISKNYARKRMANFDPAHANRSTEIAAGEISRESVETTHFSVVDKDGMGVSFTTTINSGYGSGIVVDGAGFLLNNEMDDFSAKPGAPNKYGLVGGEANAIEPNKRMLSSMTPTLVLKDSRLVLLTGSPGGSTIITTVLQVVVNLVDHGFGVEDAVARPRFHHQWLPDLVRIEAGTLEDAISGLNELGHENVNVMPPSAGIGDANSIMLTPDGMIATSDPRSAGGPAVY